jgi:hypothetical protein
MLHMFKTHLKDLGDVSVVQTVEDLAPLPATSNEPQLPQAPQLMGHGRFTHAQSLGQGADAQFPLEENGDDANPAGVAQSTEEVGEAASFDLRK